MLPNLNGHPNSLNSFENLVHTQYYFQLLKSICKIFKLCVTSNRFQFIWKLWYSPTTHYYPTLKPLYRFIPNSLLLTNSLNSFESYSSTSVYLSQIIKFVWKLLALPNPMLLPNCLNSIENYVAIMCYLQTR